MSARDLARRIGLGTAAYRFIHGPRAFIRRCSEEGPLNLWLSARGQRAMRKAATELPSIILHPDPTSPSVYFLTGAKFWYQTAFCAYSLLRSAEMPIRVTVVDDGTLLEEHTRHLSRIIPGLEVIRASEIQDRLNTALPVNKYPSLRARRLVYPHLRKLTDIHAGSHGWKLVLDSDMLFFRRPGVMLDWLSAPDRPFCLRDIETSYGYSSALLTELAGCPVPDRVNVGACGLRSDAIDWERLEYWCRTTLEREGSQYLQEQALTALLMAGTQMTVAPPDDFVVLPTRAEAESPRAILHHYVAESKVWYFRFGWRQVNLNS